MNEQDPENDPSDNAPDTPAGDENLFIDASMPELEEDPPKAPPKTSNPDSKAYKINPIIYNGRAGTIFKIWFVTVLLNVVTLGIYSFWGKTRMRKYVASSCKLDDDNFEYTGTGKELFFGFIKAIPLFIIAFGPLIAIDIIYKSEPPPWHLVSFVPLLYLYGVARFSATRYRLSRTTWRGVRGYVTGSAYGYGALAFWRMILNIISLGILIPYSDIIKHKKIIDQTYFGNIQAEYTATAGPLMATHIVTWLLAPFTIGISRFWYRAALIRHKMIGIYAGDYRFKSDVTAFDLIKLNAGNMLIIIFTLGLGFPFVIQRNMKFFAFHIFIGGDLQTSTVKQIATPPAGVGEGLDDILGLDSGIMG